MNIEKNVLVQLTSCLLPPTLRITGPGKCQFCYKIIESATRHKSFTIPNINPELILTSHEFIGHYQEGRRRLQRSLGPRAKIILLNLKTVKMLLDILKK